MKCYAKVLHIHDDIEEEILLCLGHQQLLCFADVLPYAIKIGEIYPLELSLTYLNQCNLRIAEKICLGIEQLGTGFSHKITGYLSGDRLISNGIVFQDEYFSVDYAYLNNQVVETVADRISVAFY